ncbi:uncharacterized protein STEHIDRAFT_168338 [Stereum hirsutum FP-91666 SS1]|uniref:uncharacterized protein n=1 Tax=Stereum hirsutum (strain FP-91666) TaxID=721885 RepID=UPI000440C53A|nr:uncharacterized protein STEHIDRAFT_168338 [Stereum hirsutum FP-91666 SS1]EIM87644.1 hypothetical protein STEHIDRAFT_168338 [Stereum hirsutum FP-91666 SS1]
MFASTLKATLIASLAGYASAFSITSPGGDSLWWVAQSQNTLIWTCNDNAPATTFQVLLANGDPTILTAPMAIIASVQNADCSHTITQQQAALTPATNYTILLANIVNSTDIYATSAPFEVKAAGSTFPAASATPTGSSSATSGSSPGTATSSGSSSSSTTSSSGAAGMVLGESGRGMWAAAALGVVGGIFALL